MADDTRPRPGGVDDTEASGSPVPDGESITVDAAMLSRLRREVTDLRLQIEEGVRTRQLIIVDDAGVARARITAESGGDCGFVLLDEDGFERIHLVGKPNIGIINIAGRTQGDESTHVEMFALDPEDGDSTYVGVELVDRGNSVAGFAMHEGEPGHFWTDED